MRTYGDSQRIDAEINALLTQAPQLSEELQASLARYLCVLASGYLESSCREVLSLYARDRSEGSVSRYVESKLEFFRDPNMEKILQLAGDFDPQRRQTLEQQIDEKLKTSIDSISANRNSIAHGRRSGISLGQIRQYYEAARKLVSKLGAVFPAKKRVT